ncbi:MAG: HAMP domain-containing methyl-accepting chemotaxis protein [Kiritimatiellia bacterium]
MNKLTLGRRLGLAFGTLIVLMGVLGGLAVWRMKLAAEASTGLASKFVPEVRIAQQVAIGTWATRFNIRNYTLTGDEDFLRQGRKGISELKDALKAADDLAQKYPDLVVLRQGAVDARTALQTWEEYIDKMEAEQKHLKVQQGLLIAAGTSFMQQCGVLLASQEKNMKDEIATNATPAKLDERLTKIGMVQDLMDRGMAIQLDNFQAQAMNDMKVLRDTLKKFVALDDICTGLTPLLHQQNNVALVSQIRGSAKSYNTAMEETLKSQLAVNDLKEKIITTATVLMAKGQEVAGVGLQRTTKAATEGASGLDVTVVILLVGLVVAVIVAVLIAWLSARAIAGPIREGAQVLVAAAGELSATVSQIAASSGETAAAVSETSTTIDEVRQTAQQAKESARNVADGAQSAAHAARNGSDVMRASAEGLKRIGDQMKVITGSVMSMSEKSQAIGDIITTVNNLAEQSNLLAVNASIEAARAGEQGKGFAVVAEEIRSLAEQSKEATKQVRAILNDVQKATGSAVLTTEQGGKAVEEGQKLADQAAEAINTLAAVVTQAAQAATQIAASSQQQLAGTEQVSNAMGNIKEASLQNQASTTQLATAAHNLQELGVNLRRLVEG